MNLRMLVLTALLAVGLPFSAPRAAITSVTVTPASATATLGQPNPMLLTWRVTNSFYLPIQSTQGRFTSPDGNIVLGTIGTPLSAVPQQGAGPPQPVSLPEAVVIPTTVLQAAVTQGMGTILYTRTFTDNDPHGGATGSGSVLIQVLAPALGPVSATPSSFPATLQTGGRLSTTWNVTGNMSGLAVRSVSGAFMLTPNGPVLQTVAQPLTGTIAGGVARMPETLQIPQSLVYQALAAHQGTFYFVRHFEPANGIGSGADGWVEIHVGGASSGPLAVARLSLHFNDGALRRVVGRDQPLRAVAEVQYTGGGLLQAVWEIATPPGTQGAAIYRPLLFERRYLVAGGRVILRSPPLPVDLAGRHVVRLRVQSPTVDNAALALEYTVNPALRTATARLQPLSLNTPQGGASLDAATRFGWQPVAGARAYQLEFYAVDVRTDAQPPQAGMLVRASTTHLSLSDLARAHLEPGRSYHWRVLAIGERGQVLAESDLRELLVP